MRFVQDVNKHGTHELPDMFYTGVMFGVSNANSHKVEVRYALSFLLELIFFLLVVCGRS
jgi:hypothetical protein